MARGLLDRVSVSSLARVCQVLVLALASCSSGDDDTSALPAEETHAGASGIAGSKGGTAGASGNAGTAGTTTGSANGGAGNGAGAGNGGAGNGGAGNGGAGNGGAGNGGPGGAKTSCSGSVVCDGFEAGTPGQPPGAPWAVATPSCSGTGKLAIDGAVAHGGGRSLRIDGEAGYCNHVFARVPLPSVGPVVHVRLWVRLGGTLGDGHVTFVAMQDAGDQKDLRLGGQSKVLLWNREKTDATLPELSPTGIAKSIAPTQDAWHCVETSIDTTTGKLVTRVDGADVEGLSSDGTPTKDVDGQWLAGGGWSPHPTDLRIGWESYGGTAMTLWFDDVVVASAPLGCL